MLSEKRLIIEVESEKGCEKMTKKRKSLMQVHDEDGSSHSSDEEEDSPPAGDKNKVIKMPQFVRNFSEAMITAQEAEAFQKILADYYAEKF